MDASIGDLFRSHAEDYIRIYKPPINHIKLIRAIRVCRTPALGGRKVICKSCGVTKYIYHSCGHSQCPLCQNIKRNLWQDKLSEKFLNVPYTHTVFTIAHELNTLAKLNKGIIYNITIRAAWQTIKTLTADPNNLGALPGMVTVLHTFGSDMKYHIHVHALITFVGVDDSGNWHWPKHKKKLAPYKKISNTYRDIFLEMVRAEIDKNNLKLLPDTEEVLNLVKNKRWNVRNAYPTSDTQILERYLARYINRIAISKSRLNYIAKTQKNDSYVNIVYKDYRNKPKGEAAQLAEKKVQPLVAIHQFLRHVLPPYFQKSRYYGLHHHSTFKRLGDKIPDKIKRNTDTIRIICQLISILSGIKPYACEACGGTNFETKTIRTDQKWIFNFITLPSYRGPPMRIETQSIKFY